MSEGRGLDVFGDELFSSRFPVHCACRDGDVGALVSLSRQLSDPAHLAEEDSKYGWSPLHWAAHYGQLDCVVLLVQMGCEVNTGTSRFNQTPTHTAAFGGHPQCVLWLTQAGAHANSQDFVGEAPLHKAARSGSLECIQVLLLAGAQAHLRNASGQTAADLAHAHGFLDCFSFISKTRKQLLLHGTGTSAPCGQGPLSRKRLLSGEDPGHIKKARGGDNVQSGEEPEGMEASQEADSAAPIDPRDESPRSPAPFSLPANQQAARRSSADMCGSLHLTGSPSSCVSHRPARRALTGADCRDFLHYGHYHGFGDTAEELSDYGGGIQAEPGHRQAVAGSTRLYQD
ncbi:ankyrin repeat domain-containing protein 10-like [Clinocottus analis]|uniref:ankyrin repeat domain-containing protein 10-like n=1 Tax=Clinocottus analis TaxID=304258 RepID=UPI0035C2030A